jgi:ATP-dependent DNA helicase RecG
MTPEELKHIIGSGTRKIFKYTPIYAHGKQAEIIDADIFKIIIPHDDVVAMTTPTDDTVNDTVSALKSALKSTLKSGLKTEDKILEIIKRDDKISYDDMADILEMSRRGIAKQIKKLQEEGRLRRVGPDKGGHWEVTES